MRSIELISVLSLVVCTVACKTSGKETDPRAGVETPSAKPGAASGAIRWDGPTTVAAGAGIVGPWRQNDSKFHYVDDPTVALVSDGGAAVAYVDNRRMDAYFQRYDAAGNPAFKLPVNISQTPDTFTWLPKIATSDDGGQVFALWQEIIFSGGSHGGEALFARSTDGGRTFSEPINLSNTTAGCGKGRIVKEIWHNGSLDLARSPDGTLYATWTEYEGPLRFSRSTDEGNSFSEPIHVAGTDARPARGPAIAPGKGDTVHLAWAIGEDPGGDIRVATSSDGGRTFEKPRIVEDTANYSDAPKLVVDREGALHLVWAEARDGYDGPDHIRYVRIDERARPSMRLSSVDDRPASFPYLEIDSGDRLFLAWEHYPRDERPRGIGFSYSLDRGETFSKPTVVPNSGADAPGFNANLQGRLARKLAANDDGQLTVVNATIVPDERSVVFLIRGSIGR